MKKNILFLGFVFISLMVGAQSAGKYEKIENEWFSVEMIRNWDKTVQNRDFDNGGHRSILNIRHYQITSFICVIMDFGYASAQDSLIKKDRSMSFLPIDSDIEHLRYHTLSKVKTSNDGKESKIESWFFFKDGNSFSILLSTPTDISDKNYSRCKEVALYTVKSLKIK